MAKSQIDQHTMYDGAPEMLINRVFEVEALLATSKLKTGETESWKFWKKTSDIMKYSWDYMRSFEWLLRENGYADQIDHPLPVQFTALLPICLTTPLFYS
jgi:hypothetical protein